jgi:excisionase family DNA binding protein
MTDRTPPTARQDGDRMVLSVAEAAAHLGVTPDAVRARLHRGTLFGVKDGGEWRVYLDPPPADRQDTRQDATAPKQDTDRLPIDTTIAVYERLVESQREEIAFLRSELETRTDELQRRDVLLREALGRIPQLTAGETARSPDTGPLDSAPLRPNGEATSGPETHRPSILVSAWRRLFGGG